MIINRGNFESNIDFLEKTSKITPEKTILEIGSGTGYMVNYMKRKGINIVGTEINDSYINFAKKEYNIELIKMEGSKLNFSDCSFDTVLSFDVFEHIPNSDQHLQEVRRILRPNGCYLLETPNLLTNIPFEIIKEKSFTKWKQYHCSLHTYWSLKKRFIDNGFTISFINVPIVNNYFLEKIRRQFGSPGVWLTKIINPDSFPMYLKTNFYLLAIKK